MKIGFAEILVVLIVALVVIGPNQLPDYARKLGTALREFRKASEELTKDLRESVIEPIEEIRKPVEDIAAPLYEMKEEVRANVEGLQKSVKSLERPLNVQKVSGEKDIPESPDPDASESTAPAPESADSVPAGAEISGTDISEERAFSRTETLSDEINSQKRVIAETEFSETEPHDISADEESDSDRE